MILPLILDESHLGQLSPIEDKLSPIADKLSPIEDKIWFMPVEDKPIKLVFEGNSDKPIMVATERDSNDHLKRGAIEKLIEKVKAASDDGACRLYPTKDMMDSWTINRPLSQAVNDGVLALMESWAALGKTIYNPDGTEDNKMKITNYTYNKPVTKIEWSDGTVTKVSCNPDEADQWTGFLACIAKRFLGNDVIKEWEKYTITIPAQKKAEEERRAEEERIAAKKKAKHDKWVARCEKIRKARELARQYEEEQERKEIEKIAIKKFGVPESYFGE